MMSLPVVVVCVLLAAQAPADRASKVDITLVNGSGQRRHEVARVSVPLAAGVLAGEPGGRLTVDGRETPAQARAVTRRPDGSVRRLMLSFPVRLEPGQAAACVYEPAARQLRGEALLEQTGGASRVSAQPYAVVVRDDRVELLSKADGQVLATLRAYGPRVSEPRAPTAEVIESGPWLVWLRWRQDGSDYGREVDVQVDRLGRVRLSQRILRHLRGNDWTPDFGFELSAPKAQPVRLPASPVHFLKLDARSTFAEQPALVASLKLADGTELSLANPLALRQHRGTLEASAKDDGSTTIRASRLEPVTRENDRLLLQEGMWRVVELVVQPGDAAALAAALDHPMAPRVDWRAFDAVYHTGPPLRVEHPVLERLVERHVYVLTRMSIDGDDWGNMTSYSPNSDKAAINSMVRFNHCLYVWEDYFRTADPRLRRIAIDWSENYRNFSVYWGPEQKYFGGSRRGRKNRNLPGSPHGPGTYMVRFNNAVGFCTKGFHSFWLAYEETGDPRFRAAAEAQAKWSAANVHANRGEMRNVGVVADFARLHAYTGTRLYLDNAVRLWEEFKQKQQPDLLFTQHGKPPTGNHLYIPNDQYGYAHQFYKPYMVQYATNSLPCLLELRPTDKRLRDTIIACSNWMAKAQTPGGGWGYPGPATAGLSWNPEYCHGLMLAHDIQPNEAYLDATARDLRAIVALFEKHGAIPSGISAWERVAGVKITPKLYHLATDRDRGKDFTDGRVGFSSSPDRAVYFQVVLRDYLRRRPEASLFARDKLLDQILRLPTSLPTNWAPRGPR